MVYMAAKRSEELKNPIARAIESVSTEDLDYFDLELVREKLRSRGILE